MLAHHLRVTSRCCWTHAKLWLPRSTLSKWSSTGSWATNGATARRMPCGKDEARRGTSAQNPFTCCQQHQACLRKGLKRFHAAAAQNETLPAPIIRSFALMQKRSFDIRRAMLLRAATRSLAKKLASRFDSLRSGFVRVVPGSISTLHSVRYQMLGDLSCGRLRHS